jgi:surfactin family lipopeptide synthetase B/lichenysin synthetase B
MQKLPSHMVPAQFVLLDKLPQLPNFKVDRVRLERFDAERPMQVRDRTDDPLIDEIAQIFEAVLEVHGASADDNVQSLGGDSLQAVTLELELEQRFGLPLPAELVEQRPTIRDIAQFLMGHLDHVKSADESATVAPMNRSS